MSKTKVLLELFLIAGVTAVALLCAIPRESSESHAYADAVLEPRLSAAYNDWRYQHPKDKKPAAWDHVHTLDAGDLKRYQLVRQAWRELDEAMKRAGY